jgi:hypothetical protein
LDGHDHRARFRAFMIATAWLRSKAAAAVVDIGTP